jgi:hypothetical protein
MRSGFMVATICVLASSAVAGPVAARHTELVQWRHGAEALPWERLLTLPSAGSKQYRIALQPLWAVEGGIVGIEVMVALPSEPFANLLGERTNDTPTPLVFTVEDLAAGLKSTQFGGSRTFRLPKPAKGTLRVSVLDTELGRGVGVCSSCPNIQALTAQLEIEASK